MAHRFSRWAPAVLACLLLSLVAVLSACGDDDDGGSSKSESAEQVAQKTKFPAAGGKTLAELREGLGPGPVLAPAVSVLTAGEKNRVSFGLFDRAHKQISSSASAVYVAPAGGGEAQGPFYAANESLAVKPPFQSQTVANDPDAARSIYVAQVPFETTGDYEVMGVAKLDDRIVATELAPVKVIDKGEDPVPRIGDKPPKIVTPTNESVNNDVAKIDTRVPPAPDLHEVNYADVIGKKPVLLLFATPALCQSRVCGPVVDLMEQVKSTHKGDMAFIFQEIYNDNELEKGFRPQVEAFSLPTEPWAFAIDKNGKVAARLEGAYSERELLEAIKAAES